MADGATLGMDHILSADHGCGCGGPCPPKGVQTGVFKRQDAVTVPELSQDPRTAPMPMA